MKKFNILLSFIICCSLLLTFIIPSNAQVKTMPDGEQFDAEFYAATYPDVAQALGTDEQTLYNHYIQYGKSEGRLPYPNSDIASVQQTPVSSVTLSNRRILYINNFKGLGYPTVTITNNSGKTIKYVILSISPTNAFGDVVDAFGLTTLNTTLNARYTGPLESGKSADPSWQAWTNQTITSFNINSATVEYTDGTTENLDLTIALK